MRAKLTYDELVPLARGKDVPCPLCAGRMGNPRKPVFKVWLDGDFASFFCARCEAKGWAKPEGAKAPDRDELIRRMRKAEEARVSEMERRQAKARWIWERGRSAHGTIVPDYLLSRGIKHWPSTLRFLPGRGNHAPAMLAAFGMPAEPVPGTYVLNTSDLQGVHITRLLPDGNGKATDDEGRSKIMVGPSNGWPIALIPVNDSGGLLVAEGIETALSFAHSGLGIWAAGSAGRMPALAELIAGLSCVETLTISVDDDDHQQGQEKAEALAEQLASRRPDIDIRMVGGRDGA